MNYLFFSIIIPAHNEEKLIDKTISALQNLNYPKNNYEVIIVENGSNDNTYEISKKYESANIKIFHLDESGVSLARNFGQSKISPLVNWCITLDADTILKTEFLAELNDYLNIHTDFTHGMATLTPSHDSAKARFWFWYRNLTDRLMKTLDTIHIVKIDLISKVKYDETFHFTEDLRYAKEISRYGKYFFFKTENVISSTRRFEEKGYFRMFLMNLFIGIKYITHTNSLKNKTWDKIR